MQFIGTLTHLSPIGAAGAMPFLIYTARSLDLNTVLSQYVRTLRFFAARR